MTDQFASQMAARVQEHHRRAIALLKEDRSAEAIDALVMANDYLEILNPPQEKAA